MMKMFLKIFKHASASFALSYASWRKPKSAMPCTGHPGSATWGLPCALRGARDGCRRLLGRRGTHGRLPAATRCLLATCGHMNIDHDVAKTTKTHSKSLKFIKFTIGFPIVKSRLLKKHYFLLDMKWCNF